MKNGSLYKSATKFISALLIVIFALAALQVKPSYAASCTSTVSGNWSSSGTWSCGYVPTSADDVMIANGDTVALDSNVTINSLTINDGNASSSLVISGTNVLTVTTNVTVINSTSATTKSVNVGAGTLNVGGNLIFNEGTSSSVTQLIVGTGTATVNGNITINSSGTASNAQIIFSGAGTLNVAGTYANGGTLTIGTGTVNYTGAAQTVGSYKYYNLGLSGSGVKTLQIGTTTVSGNLNLSGAVSASTVANLAITGNLNVGSGSTFITGTNYTLTVTGTTTVDGTLTLGGTGAKTFTGDVTIDSGGNWNETGVAGITTSGNLTNNGIYTASTGLHTFNGATKTIGGSDLISIPNATFTGNYTNNGVLSVGTLLTVTGGAVRLTNNGTITANTALSGTGGVTQGAGAVLNLGGTSSITTLTAAAAGNAVNYTGSAQTIMAVPYNYLVLSGSGVKTISSGTAVNTNLNIINSGGASVSIAAGATIAVNSLAFNGTGQTSGTWGGTGSGAAHINSTYFAATTGKLNVATTDARTIPTISFGTAPTPAYQGGNFTVSATTTNTDSNTLIYSVVSGPCVLVGGNVFNSTGAGTCVVQAYGAPTTNFAAASATQSINIAKASQAALTVSANPSTVVQGFTTTLSSTGGSGTGTVTYSVGSSIGCTVSGNILTVTDASGSCSVIATNSGDANYLSASSTAFSITMASFQAEINKKFSPTNILPGDTSTLSITIYNPNAIQLNNAAWVDSLVSVQAGLRLANPVNVSNSCGGSVSAVAGGTSLSLSGGTVPAKVGSTNGSCTVTVNVTSTIAGNLINTIPAGTLLAYDSGGKLATNTTPASATLQVSTVIAPTINKNFNANTIWAGASSLLTINILNQDPNNALTQVSLTDALPTNVIVWSGTAYSPALTNCGSGATLTASAGASSITLSGGTIAAGVGTTCTIKVYVTSPVQGSYINTIPSGAIQTYQGVTNALAAQATLNVQQLNLTKAFSPSTIPAGGTSTATITLQNPTSIDYTNLGLADSLPIGMTVTGTPTTTCGTGTVTYNSTTNTIALTGGTLAHSATPPTVKTCTITFTVTTPITTGSTTITNTIPAGSMQDDQNVSNPATVSANLTITGALTLTKSFSPSTITVGNPSTATVTLKNATATPITGVQMTDTLSPNLTVYAAPAATQCSGAVTYTTGSVTLSGGTIPASGTCTVVFQVTTSVTGTYVNTIPINGVTGYQGSQALGNLTSVSSGNLTVQASALPVTGSKSFNPTSISAGGNSDLSINITAPTDTSLSSVSVTDNLPAGVTISNSTAASKNGNCSGGTLSATTGASTITWTGGSISAGATCTIQVYVTASTPGSFINDIPPAQISDTEGRAPLTDFTATLNVSNFQVSKVFYPASINQNGLSTLTITLTNPYTSAMTNVNLTDLLTTMGSSPNNVVIAPTPNASTTCGGTLTATAGASTITLSGGYITAQVGGTNGICTINVDVKGLGASGTRTNTIPIANVNASLGGNTVYPLAPATANLTITALTITVNKSFAPLLVYGGSSSVLDVTLTNPNNAALTGIAFTDSLPAGMTIAAPANLNTGTCGGTITGNSGDSSFSFSGGSLAATKSCDLTLNAITNVNGTLTNTIPIGAVTTSNGASNTAAAAASLTNLPGVSVSKNFSPDSIMLGANSILTITIQNTGSVELTNIGLQDTLPDGLVIADSPSSVVNHCGGSLSADSGSRTILLATGDVAASTSCTISVPVTGSAAGSFTNIIPANTLTDAQSASNTSDATDTLKILGYPTLTTTPSANGVVGTVINDSASLLGGVSPTGAVTFKLFSPSDPTCSGAPVYTQTVNSAPYATTTGFTTNTTGVWHWTADYAGDDNNSSAKSGCSAEPVTISPATPTITTNASPSTGTMGTAITAGDSVTSMGSAFNPTGSIIFTLYSDSACKTAVSGMSGSAAISGGLASWSKSWTPAAAGTYYWIASYAGDANNNATTTTCAAANEKITIGQTTPTVTTNIHDTSHTVVTSVLSSTSVHDSASVSGLASPIPAGTVTFSYFNNGTCTAPTSAVSDALSLNTGSVDGTTFTQTPVLGGNYSFRAHYNGDSNYLSADGSCEPLFVETPVIHVVKSSTTTAITLAGQVVPYTFTVTNTGNIPLSGVTVTDAKCNAAAALQAGGDTNGDSKLDLTEIWVYTCNHTVTQAEVNAGGKLSNTVTADSTESVPATSTLDIPVMLNPSISLAKTPTPTTYDTVGQNISYSYVITNTGNITLAGPFTVADDKATVTCDAVPTGGLIPGGTLDCSASYAITQADLDAGSVTNKATASGSGVSSAEVRATVNAEKHPSISLAKTPTPTTYDTVGQNISYSYVITNTGNVTLAGPFTVADDKATVTCDAVPTGGLTPGGTLSCSASYAITQADLDAGSVTNKATASGNGVSSAEVQATVNAEKNPSISLEKDASPTTYDTVGQNISYSYVITNTGNVTLAGPFTVADDKATVTCDAVPTGGLIPGGTLDCSARYAITQADLDAGSVTNTATASGNGVSSAEVQATVNAEKNPSISLTKTPTPTTYDTVGQNISYSYVITNTGNVTLAGPFTVADDKATVTCDAVPTGGLTPGGTLSCSASYAITQADLDAGSVTNKATASGNGVSSEEVKATVNAEKNPSISLEKDASPTTYDTVGQNISYSYIITNTGNVTLTGPFTVTDDKASVTCDAVPTGGLIPGGTLDCSASYAITQADLDAGSVTNKATASGNGVSSEEVQATVNAEKNPSISLEKEASPTTYDTVGQNISYSYVITNIGNVTLAGPFTVADDKASVTCDAATTGGLTPGGTLDCSASYAITQADLDAGSVTNTATASGNGVSSAEVQATVNAEKNPSISLTKTPTPTTYDTVGQNISYSYVITNTGNVTLAGPFTVADDKATVTCDAVPTGGLIPGGTLDCSASYAITQADINAGSVTNTATASGNGVSSAEVQATVTAEQKPAITLEKTGTLDLSLVSPSSQANIGDKITYTFKVTNTGNVALYNIDLSDLVSGVTTEGGPISSLAPGSSDSTTFKGSYTLTAADIINGTFTNTASVTGETKDKTPVSASDDDVQTITQVPSISLTKSGTLDQTVVAPSNLVNVGDKITYAFTVKNTGNLDLSNVTLADVLPGVVIKGGPIALLHPGEQDKTTFTGVYTITQEDINAGSVANTATVTGTPTVGANVTDEASSTQNINNDPIIGIAKRVASDPVKVSPGTWDVTYSFLVKNYGNIVLNKLQVSDDLKTVFPAPTTFVVQSYSSPDFTVVADFDGDTKTDLLAGTDSLPVGGSGTITLVVRVVPAEAGPFNNIALASAESVTGAKASDPSQLGADPDPDHDGNPTNNNDPTPVSFGAHPFDPPIGFKTVNAKGKPNLVWTMVWINNSNIIDTLSEVHDPIPSGTTFVPGLVDSGFPIPTDAPDGSTSLGVSCSAGTSTTTVTTLCYYEGKTVKHPLGQIIWAGSIAPDLGVTDPDKAKNAIRITFTTTNDKATTRVTNKATIDADLNGDGDLTDAGEKNVVVVSAGWKKTSGGGGSTPTAEPTPAVLPATGFTPGMITKLPDQPKALAYSSLGEIWLEIPSLNVQSSIVGVPEGGTGWDVSWLGKNIGWLNSTAYPTHPGNSLLAGHINDTNGYPGPFANIDKLKYGDLIIIHAWNQEYIYEVRETKIVSATDTSDALKHEEYSWITLVTCRDYDAKAGAYNERYLVRAVLTKVQ